MNEKESNINSKHRKAGAAKQIADETDGRD